MRTSTSVATALLAAGAGWLAAKMWQENAYGIRDRVHEGGDRMRRQGERMRMRGQRFGEEMRHRGEEAWERGRHIAEESLQQGRGGMIQRGREMLRRIRGARPGDYAEEEDYGAYSGPYGEDFGEYGRGGYYRGPSETTGRRTGKSASRSAEVFRSQGYRSY